MKFIITLSALLMLTFSVSGSELFGKVYDETTLEAIPGVEISVMGKKTKSDDNGYYLIRNLDNGPVILGTQCRNYVPFNTSVSIESKKHRFDIPLKSALNIKQTPPKEEHIKNEESIPSVKNEPVIPILPQQKQEVVPPVKTESDKPAQSAAVKEKTIQPVSLIDDEKLFTSGKKFLDEGQFLKALPVFQQMLMMGNNAELRMKSAYYLAIIYKTQQQNQLALDYLFKTLCLADFNNEDRTFLNQLQSEIVQIYQQSGNSSLAKPMCEEILMDEKINFPVTNFNCFQFLSEWYREKGNFQQMEVNLKKAIELNVNPNLKSKPYLSAIDLYINREEYAEADALLKKLITFYQSPETDKRELLVKAMLMYQISLQKGDVPSITGSIIPEMEKSLQIDPEYPEALSGLTSIQFATGKLTSNLSLVLTAKKNLTKLMSVSPQHKDQSGKLPAEVMKEIELFLKSF